MFKKGEAAPTVEPPKNFADVEESVNEWLREQDGQIEVVDIKQSMSGGSLSPPSLVITIWYDEIG